MKENMVKVKTPKGEVSTPLKIEASEQAVTVWEHAVTCPVVPGMTVIPKGTATGRKDKSGNPILTKALVIKTPTVKDTGKSGDDAQQLIVKAGTDCKPILQGRIARFSNDAAVIIRRYTESSGNGKSVGDKVSVTYERKSVEGLIERFAREYKISVDEVRKRLSIPVPGASIDV
jgi:hypothetical protein